MLHVLLFGIWKIQKSVRRQPLFLITERFLSTLPCDVFIAWGSCHWINVLVNGDFKKPSVSILFIRCLFIVTRPTKQCFGFSAISVRYSLPISRALIYWKL